ncbi:MAG: alpha/beta hydrolase [Anaerolineales bacterium]|nr:alpha/beta hydrolase [Anaerolineales bacterium]MCB9129179.1 alpha/beta hydrolase [Ardenticatenales bacterium]
MSYVTANGIKMHYWQVGEGPDLVLIHGMAGNLALWHLFLVPELRKYFRVTTYDIRGHGRTEVPPTGYTTRDLAHDLVALMDALDIEVAHLMGHSVGADIALHTALIRPERVDSLVLIEAGIPALVNERKKSDWEGWRYWAETIEQFTGIQIPREKWTDLGYMVKMSAQVPIVFGPARGRPRNTEMVERLLDETTLIADYEVVHEMTLENLPTIPHRKLLVYDDESPYRHSYDALATLLTHCTPVLLPPSEHSHFGPLTQPEALLGLMGEFFGLAAPA